MPLNPLVLSYDKDRQVWVVRDGTKMNWMTEGAFLGYLDEYKDRVLRNGGKSPLNILDRFKFAWDRRMRDIVVVNHRIYDRKFDRDIPEPGFASDARKLSDTKSERGDR